MPDRQDARARHLARATVSSHIEAMLTTIRMWVLILAPALLAPIAFVSPTATRAQVCVDDYSTVETYTGTILEIVPAPEPFSSADILIKGPDHCTPLWMQVLKSDVAQCRI